MVLMCCWAGECVVSDGLQDGLVEALQSAGFMAQEGIVDFSLLGDSNDCNERSCVWSNPSTAYAYGILPLSPSESLEKKLGDEYDLPADTKSDLNGSRSWESGLSPEWQLRADEVVLLFGCTPSHNYTRYFGVTGYVERAYVDNDRKKGWVNIKGSVGDTLSIAGDPDNGFGFENRLKTSAKQPESFDMLSSTEDIVGKESAFQKIMLVMMGSSKSKIEEAQKAIDGVLTSHKLEGIVSVIPIPDGLGEVGLATEDNAHFTYYSLILRATLQPGVRPTQIGSYSGSSPLRVWRLTPKMEGTLNPEDRFQVKDSPPVPRIMSSALKWRSEHFLKDAHEFLIAQVEKEYTTTHVIAHSVLAQGLNEGLGVEYGVTCVEQGAFCGYETRDAAFIYVYPLVLLDTKETVTYVIGVNHRISGTAMYSSVSINTFDTRLGVGILDDVALYGSAEPYLKGTEFENLHEFFYVLPIARNCEGLDNCVHVPLEGKGRVMANETMAVLERLYVNPATGVAPSPVDLLLPHTLTFTPKAQSTDNDKQERVDAGLLTSSPCTKYMAALGGCVMAVDKRCCNALTNWVNNDCFCSDVGKLVIEASGQDSFAAKLAAAVCGLNVPYTC